MHITESLRQLWSVVRSALDIAASAVMVGAACFVAWSVTNARDPGSQRVLSVPASPISLAGSPSLGSANADVAMLMFSDFECPFCAKFANEVLPAVKAKYVDTGLLQIVYRHLPLPIHPRALAAAIAAECAARQQRFWPMHDRLFASPRNLELSDFLGYATALGLDQRGFESCLEPSAANTVRLEQDIQLARQLRVKATPSFFFGTVQEGQRLKVVEVMSGAQPGTSFESVIERILDAK
jgi:protein-disulfide isomerase